MASGWQLALASAPTEFKLALFQGNFDFSLIKREAPATYKEIGSNISSKRREAAEDGEMHKTAQRLGSLFRSVLPKTPSLVATYGLRGSEIVKELNQLIKNSSSRGPFVGFAGVDATSLWAAATSSDQAVAVHLLACMLAEMFTREEAVAIWQELVDVQKRKLLNDECLDEYERIRNAATASADIQQHHIEEWDNSARAWLAATEKLASLQKRQTQLRLVLGQIGAINMSAESSLHASVLLAWRTALEKMDQLITGGNYAISEPSVLAAVSSWRLYPDMVVLGDKTQRITQRDPLMKQAGYLTIGLKSTRSEDPGVYWALRLSYLKYYGEPVPASGSMHIVPNRLSFDQFLIAVLGATLACWGVPVRDFKEATQLIVLIAQVCLVGSLADFKDLVEHSDPELSWLVPLAYASNLYCECTDEQRPQIERLLRTGSRRPRFMSSSQPLRDRGAACLFVQPLEFLEWVRDPDAWLDVLRNALQSMPDAQSQSLLIRKVSIEGSERHCHLETLFPIASEDTESRSAKRWNLVATNDQSNQETPRSLTGSSIEDLIVDAADVKLSSFSNSIVWKNCPRELANLALTSIRCPESNKPVVFNDPWLENQVKSNSSGDLFAEIGYDFVVGDLNTVALFALRNNQQVKRHSLESYTLSMQNLIALLRSDMVDTAKIKKFYSTSPRTMPPGVMESLQALGYLTRLYSDLPDARIAAKIFDNQSFNLGTAFMTQKKFEINKSYNGWLLTDDRNTGMGLIAMLELGEHFEGGLDTTGIFAFSVNDSIYLMSELLNDPSTAGARGKLHRVFGSLGKPGLTFIFQPNEPQIRKPGFEEWHALAHDPFDGKIEDNFADTSLHLRFTGFEKPMILNNRGSRFTAVRIMEAVISLQEGDRWIADLDLKFYPGDFEVHVIHIYTCTCQTESNPKSKSEAQDLISIDTWSELLEFPEQGAVFRAHQNWEARLAASIVCRMLGHITIVFGKDTCWECAWRKCSTVLKADGEPRTAVAAAGDDQKSHSLSHYPVYIL